MKYQCPHTKEILEQCNDCYLGKNGNKYPIIDGIVDFLSGGTIDQKDSEVKEYYENLASVYDDFQYLTFHTFNADEDKVRRDMVSLLEIKSGDRVLETAAGTGINLKIMDEILSGNGEITAQDISVGMLKQAKIKLKEVNTSVNYVISNSNSLPFGDQYFDSTLSFGGISVFSDIKKALEEMVRVTKIGGRIVVGDESLQPWLKETVYGQILLNQNKLFANELPLKYIPKEARDVKIRWIIGGAYYLIDFTVGEGEPEANFDYEIPGSRGGTHKTRFYGQLEGVTSETKELALKAREKLGISMHKWLDELVKREAKKVLENN